MTPEDKNFRVNVRWGVSTDEGNETFDLEDLGCESIEEWNSLDELDKEDRLQEALDNLPQDRVFISVEGYEEL